MKTDSEILVAFKPVTRFWTWFLQAFTQLIFAFLLQQNERTLSVLCRIITIYKKENLLFSFSLTVAILELNTTLWVYRIIDYYCARERYLYKFSEVKRFRKRSYKELI